MSRLPTFILAGVPKSGTTSLYHYLGQHPAIYLSPIKEPTFFGAPDVLALTKTPDDERRIRANVERTRAFLSGPMREPRDLGLVTEWDDYVRLFRGAGTAPAVGEGSVGYWWLPGAAGAIRSRLPDVRLVFLLRDPAERLFSHYLGGAWEKPGRSFASAFQDGLKDGGDWSRAIRVGCYHDHLERFFSMFPREQTQVHLYDDFRREPASVMRAVFGFLGVDESQAIDFTIRMRQPAVPRFPLLHRAARSFSWIFRGLPGGWRNALRRVAARPRGEIHLDPADRRVVTEHYRDQVERTAALIGRDLSAWLR